MSGLIAIVGRPNVGKSALFNRIVRKRIAIVHDMPGVTRDRVTAEAEWQGRPFTLVDTGGIGLMRREKAEDVITQAAFDQVQIAIESADLILLVVNVQEGIVPLDAEVAKRLRVAGKPVVVVVNKVDTYRAEAGVTEFSALGFERILPVSAIHGDGLDPLMEEVLKHLPKPTPEELAAVKAARDIEAREAAGEDVSASRERHDNPNRPRRIAIVGRPNVGKSSMINRLTNSSRVIVSPIAGTTRDAVDVPFEVDTDGVRSRYVLVDTAGVRKARRIDDTVEYFSVERTKDAIARCDIAVLVLDAEGGILEQDKKIADLITENRRACIVVVNKWDLVAEAVRTAREAEIEARKSKDPNRGKKLTTLSEFGEWVQEKLFFLDYAPVIFTSAKDGFQMDRLLEAIRYVGAQLMQKVPTAILNRTLQDCIERRQPVSDLGHRLKFYYATQVRTAPHTFLLFVNRDELLNTAYDKYLQGELRKAFGFEGCPLILVPKPRPKTIESFRKFAPVGGSGGGQRRGAPRKGPRGTAVKKSMGIQGPRPKFVPAAGSGGLGAPTVSSGPSSASKPGGPGKPGKSVKPNKPGGFKRPKLGGKARSKAENRFDTRFAAKPGKKSGGGKPGGGKPGGRRP